MLLHHFVPPTFSQIQSTILPLVAPATFSISKYQRLKILKTSASLRKSDHIKYSYFKADKNPTIFVKIVQGLHTSGAIVFQNILR